MKRVTAALAIVATLLGVLATETAWAHGRGRVSVGVGFGFGGYWPGYWGWPGYWYPPYPHYYPAPYYSAPTPEPTYYIERGDAQAAPEPRRDWWYYCPETKTYYPYVKQCAGGWQRVEPRPQGESTNPVTSGER